MRRRSNSTRRDLVRNHVKPSDAEALRGLLKNSEAADLFDKQAGKRVGGVIARLVQSRKLGWRLRRDR